MAELAAAELAMPTRRRTLLDAATHFETVNFPKIWLSGTAVDGPENVLTSKSLRALLEGMVGPETAPDPWREWFVYQYGPRPRKQRVGHFSAGQRGQLFDAIRAQRDRR